MEFVRNYGKELVALAVPFVSLILNAIFQAKARLVQAIPHTFTFLVHEPLKDAEGKIIQPTQTAHTRSKLIGNTGQVTATGVEVVFNWKPQYINVWPPRHFDERIEADKRYSLLFGSLAPNEYLNIESLSINMNLPEVVLVRSDQCLAEAVEVYPQQVFPKWQRGMFVVLFFAGIGAVVYIAIIVLQFLVLGTPFGH
ncbi:MAG TPA: hypothetical protein VN915_16785 [Elusimicrobiota bacterium]|nr:hypothetical protein [Elusimicrobiota bacterium]